MIFELMNVDYASCYSASCLSGSTCTYTCVRTHTRTHTNTHSGILNEYVCPAEGWRGEMNSSGFFCTHCFAVSSSQSSEQSHTQVRENKGEKDCRKEGEMGHLFSAHHILHISFLFFTSSSTPCGTRYVLFLSASSFFLCIPAGIRS